jgi:hypothetical protein
MPKVIITYLKISKATEPVIYDVSETNFISSKGMMGISIRE